MEEVNRKKLEIAVQENYSVIEKLRQEIGKVVVGQKSVIDRLLMALFSGGHVLIEGVPGIAKTLMVRTLARCLSLHYKRIQFTPDLLPSDVTGMSVFHPKEATFSVEKGPVFTNVVLADEINRAPPKVQSALLEVMQEKQVTIGGISFHVETPFLVLATQNPIEHEGTYPLPEAQTDRFLMKVRATYPNQEEEQEIVQRMALPYEKQEVASVLDAESVLKLQKLVSEIYIDEKIVRYILDVVFATRFPSKIDAHLASLIEYGASPRASIGLVQASKACAFLQGRYYVTPFDVAEVAADVLRHRLILSYEAEAQNIDTDAVIKKIFDKIAAP